MSLVQNIDHENANYKILVSFTIVCSHFPVLNIFSILTIIPDPTNFHESGKAISKNKIKILAYCGTGGL